MADESHKERVDRELIELLNELRVALPGVQVLFAFLLGLPFTGRFERVSGSTEAMYVVALTAAATASAFLIAPGAYHRLTFRSGTRQKEQMLHTANVLAIVGTVMLALGICSSMYVVASFLYGPPVGLPLTLAVAALFGSLWYLLPLVRRARG